MSEDRIDRYRNGNDMPKGSIPEALAVDISSTA